MWMCLNQMNVWLMDTDRLTVSDLSNQFCFFFIRFWFPSVVLMISVFLLLYKQVWISSTLMLRDESVLSPPLPHSLHALIVCVCVTALCVTGCKSASCPQIQEGKLQSSNPNCPIQTQWPWSNQHRPFSSAPLSSSQLLSTPHVMWLLSPLLVEQFRLLEVIRH